MTQSTRDALLTAAQDLIQVGGYAAMSLSDVAGAVGIAKPSIMHHFPGKMALGVAVVQTYSAGYRGALQAVLDDPDAGAAEALRLYVQPYRRFAEDGSRICLCGALAAEYGVLPPPMQDQVRRFFSEHEAWLEAILDRGAATGDLILPAPSRDMARLAFSALQGALVTGRTLGRSAQVDAIFATLMRLLLPPSEQP